ncbi:hypoxia induced protein conserved region-domain-containing protein [Kockiozyma suomiensis]|uniref:hypoxia induced protein conserved region-domain-containing protein n=1 Tax=Kockiozyma suomiensis TaxID=1337062 RepID=UPI003343EB8C
MPPPSSFDAIDPEDQVQQLTGFKKLWYKCKEQPLVPIGVIATIWALSKSAISIRQGNSRKANKYLTTRVALQGFTIAAMVGGTALLNNRDGKTKAEREVEKAARRKQLWLEELERQAGVK